MKKINSQGTNFSQLTYTFGKGNKIKKQGNIIILILWTIFLWPVAIYYLLTRSFSLTVVQRFVSRSFQYEEASNNKEEIK